MNGRATIQVHRWELSGEIAATVEKVVETRNGKTRVDFVGNVHPPIGESEVVVAATEAGAVLFVENSLERQGIGAVLTCSGEQS